MDIYSKLTMSDCCVSQRTVLPVFWALVSWSVVDLLIDRPGEVLLVGGADIVILCSPLLCLQKVAGGMGFKPRPLTQRVRQAAACSAVVPLFRGSEAPAQEWVHSLFPQHYVALAVIAGLRACAAVIFMFPALTVYDFQFTVLTGYQPLGTLWALTKTTHSQNLMPSWKRFNIRTMYRKSLFIDTWWVSIWCFSIFKPHLHVIWNQ